MPSAVSATGYVLWLIAISIVDDNATVGQWGPTGVAAVGLLLGVFAAMWGWSATPARQIRVGGVCVRPADPAGGSDAGRARRRLRLRRLARVVQRDVQRGHRRGQPVVLPCEQAEFDQLTPVQVHRQLLPGGVADRPVLDQLIRRRSAAPAGGRSVAPGGRRRPARRARRRSSACMSASSPAWRAIRRWCCSSYSHERRCATRRITNSVSIARQPAPQQPPAVERPSPEQPLALTQRGEQMHLRRARPCVRPAFASTQLIGPSSRNWR